MRHKTGLSALLIAAGIVFSTSVAFAEEKAEKAADKAEAKTEEKAAGNDEARAMMLSYTCAGCHGTDGVSVGPASPSIAGMAEDTFTEAMLGFKAGERPSTIMQRIAEGYSEEDIKAMATFFAKQEFKPAKQEFDEAKAKEGAKIHKKNCEKCHEEGGALDVDGSGRLAGQWAPYLEYSLADYLDGSREAPKKMMKKLEKVKKDGEEGFAALVHYYASQQ